MRSKKGLTLIEVILSLAILGIISVAFLTSISSHFNFLNKTKDITQKAFLAQREMEKEIDILKDKIKDPNEKKNLELKDRIIFGSLGGLKVNYVEVKKEYDNKHYYTLISDVKQESLTPLKLESIESKLKKGTVDVSYGYGTGAFDIIGKFKNKEKDEDGKIIKYDHMLTIVEWYASTDDYNIPIPKDSGLNLEDDILYNSYYYPLFPRDYVLVSNDTIYNFGTNEIKLDNIDKYSGRHIIFTATPAAKSGKIGVQGVSDSIFISGLPVTEGLIIHFDAAYINPYDNNMIQKDGERIKIKRWLDISSILYNNEVNQLAQQNNLSMMPELVKTEMGLGFVGQFARFENGQSLSFINSENNSNKYVMAIVRNRNINQETVFLKNDTVPVSIPIESEIIDNNWTLIEKEITLSNNTFTLGDGNIDIAEIIVYANKPTDENIVEIRNYINDKYKPPVISGDIVELKDMSKQIIKGQNFYLPSVVVAEMNRGTQKYVTVSWTGTFDINTAGVYELIGTSIDNPLKKMKYTLTVVED